MNKRTIFRILTLSAIFIMVTLSSCNFKKEVAPPMTADELLTFAEESLSEKDFERAIEYFEQYVELKPKKSRGYIGLAEAYSALDDTEKAIEWLNKGSEATDGDAKILSALDKYPKSKTTTETIETLAPPVTTFDPESYISVDVSFGCPSTATADEISLVKSTLEKRLKSYGVVNSIITENSSNRLQLMFSWSTDNEIDTGVFVGLLGTPGELTLKNADSGSVILSGKDVSFASPEFDGSNSYSIVLTLSEIGADIYSKATEILAQSSGSISVCIDDEVFYSQRVISKIDDGRVVLKGVFSETSAWSLVNLINVGTLPFKLEVLESHYNDPNIAEIPKKLPTEEPLSTPMASENPETIDPTTTPMPTTVAEKEYILPESSSRALTNDDLSGLTKDQLRIARNEIYARYGRQFNDENLSNYFNSKAWYVSLPKLPVGTDPTLTKLELSNIDLIKAYEAR